MFNGVFAVGFGLDVKVFSILSIRGEVRDFCRPSTSKRSGIE